MWVYVGTTYLYLVPNDNNKRDLMFTFCYVLTAIIAC